jgi:hypothetical protein
MLSELVKKNDLNIGKRLPITLYMTESRVFSIGPMAAEKDGVK